MNFKDRILGGLWGAVTGDALGVPVEFEPRYIRKKDPVVGMRGFGTFNLPPGSWSDDSSLMLCTVEALTKGFDTKHMAELFVKWLTGGYLTPFGKTFDVGRTTYHAVMNIIKGTPPEEAGLNTETDNGNGSLMRILPVGIYFAFSPDEEIISYAHRASSLTHRHPRSLIACGIYCLMLSSLIKGNVPFKAYEETVDKSLNFYNTRNEFKSELFHFDRILSGNISKIDEDDIESDGYVVHTLEASLWYLLNTESYRDAVLKAVNLGYDTDTTGIVTGGLAGIYYGIDSIPREWIDTIARKEEITLLFERFLSKIPYIQH